MKLGRQTTTLNDKGEYPTTQVKGLGQINQIRQFTPYGYFCSPPLNSTWLIFPARGNYDDLVGIGHDFEKRFKNLLPGEVALANTETGQYIKLDKDGNINIFTTKDINVNCLNANVTVTEAATITAKTANLTVSDTMTITCPTTNWTGDINLTGTLNATVDVIATTVSLASHIHSAVVTGPNNSGPPVP
jgi:phage gp45-like